jgi:mortality factor 4-like protein 1
MDKQQEDVIGSDVKMANTENEVNPTQNGTSTSNVTENENGADINSSGHSTATTQPSTSSDPSKAQFKIGDKVLAIHGVLRYVAKILDVDAAKGYFIHYDGWNHRWDEWVPIDRIFEDNEENRKISEKLKMEQLSKQKRSNNSSSNSSKRKRDTDDVEDDDKKEDEPVDTPTPVKLNLSEDLKTYVIRDWENLTQNGKICNLPKPSGKTVVKILEDFIASKKRGGPLSQICDGLQVYFDRALPTMLLYRVERAQYDRLRSDNANKRNCELYGGEHLLRLFVRLPQLLGNTELDESETKQLCNRLQDLLKFISKNASEYFGNENDGAYSPYVAAPQASAAN